MRKTNLKTKESLFFFILIGMTYSFPAWACSLIEIEKMKPYKDPLTYCLTKKSASRVSSVEFVRDKKSMVVFDSAGQEISNCYSTDLSYFRVQDYANSINERVVLRTWSDGSSELGVKKQFLVGEIYHKGSPVRGYIMADSCVIITSLKKN